MNARVNRARKPACVAPEARPVTRIPAAVRRVLAEPGRPLDERTRALMEQRLGRDLSAVRIHDSAAATDSARVMAARAYTTGQHIVFASGRYSPHSASGRRLLEHELAHTIQQRGATLPPGQDLLMEDSRLEQEARDVGSATGNRPALTAASAITLQREPSPEAAFNIRLAYPPSQSEEHKGLSLVEGLAVLRQFANRIDAHLQGGYEGHRYLQDVARDQYIVSGISRVLGGHAMPPLSIWTGPRDRLARGREAIGQGDVAAATRELQQAANETWAADRQIYEYREGTISGAERAVFALEVAEVAGAAAITVATGGGATAVLAGAGYAGAQRLAGEASATYIGLQDRIDWAGIAFDTLFAAVAGRYGGKLGASIAARLGGRITARVASSLIVGRASGLAHAMAREVFDAARGATHLTVEGFIDRLASQLTARALFLDLVAHAVGSAGAKGSGGKRDGPEEVDGTQAGRSRAQVSPDGVPTGEAQPLRLVVNRPSEPAGPASPRIGQPSIASSGRTATAVALQEPVAEPAPERILRSVPAPAPEPAPAQATAQTTAKPRPQVGTGVAIAAAAGPASQTRDKRGGNHMGNIHAQGEDIRGPVPNWIWNQAVPMSKTVAHAGLAYVGSLLTPRQLKLRNRALVKAGEYIDRTLLSAPPIELRDFQNPELRNSDNRTLRTARIDIEIISGQAFV